MASSNMETVSILVPPGTKLCKILNLSLMRCLLSLAATLCGSVDSLTPLVLFLLQPFFFSLPLLLGFEEALGFVVVEKWSMLKIHYSLN
uniref:Uncharacterized protein n=1 Tax=Rhizophora mucronata TaxID=61149 RepID=A0A2P2Q0Q9_RHIMU